MASNVNIVLRSATTSPVLRTVNSVPDYNNDAAVIVLRTAPTTSVILRFPTPFQRAYPTAFQNANKFGVPVSLSTASISPTGNASTNAFGSTGVAPDIEPAGNASTNAFGSATVLSVASIQPTGNAATDAFGTASVATDIEPSGNASTLAFGTPTMGQTSPALDIDPAGNASTNAFGTATVASTASSVAGRSPPSATSSFMRLVKLMALTFGFTRSP